MRVNRRTPEPAAEPVTFGRRRTDTSRIAPRRSVNRGEARRHASRTAPFPAGLDCPGHRSGLIAAFALGYAAGVASMPQPPAAAVNVAFPYRPK